jgi:hypothetical protein
MSKSKHGRAAEGDVSGMFGFFILKAHCASRKKGGKYGDP